MRVSWLGAVGSLTPRGVLRVVAARNFSHTSSPPRSRDTCVSLLTRNPRNVVSFSSVISQAHTTITLTNSSVSDQTRHDLVERLPVLPCSPDATNVAPVFLVSPAFAPCLYGRPSLCNIAVDHVFREAVHSCSVREGTIHAVFAVVDKLPLPALSSGNYPQNALDDKFRGLEQSGCEGLSVLQADRNALFGSVLQKAARRDVAAGEPEPALLYDTTVCSSGVDDSVPIEISTRVANTVFTTGQPHTLIATRWGYSKEVEKLLLQDTRHLASLRIKSPSSASSAYPSAPLHAITRPREITAGMGNVVSQISAENKTQAPVPASSELERILPEYVRKHDLENQVVAVWALIMPRVSEDKMNANNNNNNNNEPGLEDLSDSIIKGGRLHRVTGGGGGWGKKQGLLSLDPEYRYEKDVASSSELPIQRLFENQTDDEVSADPLDELPNFLLSAEDDAAASSLTAIAKPGDLVQFFVASLDRADTTAPGYVTDHNPHSYNDVLRKPSTRTFGVIPRTDEDLPPTTVEAPSSTSTDEESSDGADNVIIALPNHFGALSEKSVTWANSSADCSPDAEKQLSGTKLDVPGSRIVIES